MNETTDTGLLGVVIPVYRGGGTVGGVLETLWRFAAERRMPCRVALVADGGGEKDEEAITVLAGRYHGVTAVLLKRNEGQQRALYHGIRELVDCAFIVTMDDDGAHPVALLDSMLKAVRNGADVCYGVPARHGDAPLRRLGALCRDALFTACFRLPAGTRVGAYRVMTGALARNITPEPDGFLYLSAALMRFKPRVACLRYEPGPGSPSRYTLGKLLALYRGLLLHYTPLRAFRRTQKETETGDGAVVPGKGLLWEP